MFLPAGYSTKGLLCLPRSKSSRVGPCVSQGVLVFVLLLPLTPTAQFPPQDWEEKETNWWCQGILEAGCFACIGNGTFCGCSAELRAGITVPSATLPLHQCWNQNPGCLWGSCCHTGLPLVMGGLGCIRGTEGTLGGCLNPPGHSPSLPCSPQTVPAMSPNTPKGLGTSPWGHLPGVPKEGWQRQLRARRKLLPERGWE